MESPLLWANTLFLQSILLGFLFGLLYEVFRFLRLAIPHPDLVTNLEDLIFFLPATLLFLFFTFAFSDGVIRWFSLFGVLLGFFLYRNTLGKILWLLSREILALIRAVLFFVYRITLRPLKNVFKKITITLFTKCRKGVIIGKEAYRKQKRKKEMQILLKKAERGFPKGM